MGLQMRFGSSLRRVELLDGLRQALVALRDAGCRTAYVDGSFVAEKEAVSSSPRAPWRSQAAHGFSTFSSVTERPGRRRESSRLIWAPSVITNERQYAITKAELRRFEEASEEQRQQGPAEGIDPRIGGAMVDALVSQAETLREEIQRYEELRDGRITGRELRSLRDLPGALIEARIVAGLTQKQLGERLDIKEQQVQRWEANFYSGVGVERLQEVADTLGMEVRETVSYAPVLPA